MARAQDMTNRAIQSRPQAGGVSLITQIEGLKGQLEKAISSSISVNALIRTVTTEVRKTPRLGQCTKESFFGALFDCALVGLMPGPLGHVFLIPYGSECSFQLGYKGILELVRRSGQVDDIYAYPVFEGDEFSYSLGLHTDIKHIPASSEEMDVAKTAKKLGGKTMQREVTFVYAVAYIKGMKNPRIEVMSRDQVNEIMGRSKAAQGKSSPWSTDFSEMARKTVLKRLCKTLPLGVEISGAINKDERVSHYVEVEGTVQIEDVKSIYDDGDDINDAPEEERKAVKKPVDKVVEKVDKATGEITEEQQPSLLD